MTSLPDHPDIRKAERDGYPDDEPVLCPCCGEECDTIFLDYSRTAFGCEMCVRKLDAWDWFQDMKEASRPDWADEED